MRRGRVPDQISQQRETTDGKVGARLDMQVGGRLGRVIGSYSGGLLSLAVLESHPW